MPKVTLERHTVRIDLDGNGPGPTQEELDAHAEAMLGGFTREELDAAFKAVQDKVHWKNPIDAIVEVTMRDVLEHAIPYYTGTPADFEEVEGRPGLIRVFADGYFAGPCN